MKIYEMSPDHNGWSHSYGFKARHIWGLPGVKCSICGHIGGTVGLIYPLLTLPPEVNPKPYQTSWPVRLERFDELIQPLRGMLDPSLPLRPGTQFGPLRGTACGKHGDFTWVNSWTPLISSSAFLSLEGVGITTLVAAPTMITPYGRTAFQHLELSIEPRASIAPDAFTPVSPNPCPGCGWISIAGTAFEKCGAYRLLRSSIPAGQDVFRMIEFPAYKFATERFVEAVKGLGLTNIEFSEVEVVDN